MAGGANSEFCRRFEKRLEGVSTRADSIQTLSQYAIHHKAEHVSVVQIWEKHLKISEGKSDKLLALFYVCNDIVQNCRRKSADAYLKTFESALLNILPLLNHSGVTEKIERVLSIWGERRIYHEKTVDLFKRKLHGNSKKANAPSSSVSSAVSINDSASAFSVSDLISKFKSDSLIEKLRYIERLDSDMAGKSESVKNLDIDVTDSQVIGTLKDKSEGKEFCEKFERSHIAIKSFVDLLQKQIQVRKKLVDSLESAEVYYDSQYNDVKKITHIYDKYLQNVKTVIKKVKERQSSLPSPRSDDGGDTPSSGDSDNMDIEKDGESELTKKLDSVAKMGQHIYHLPSVPILQQSPAQVRLPAPPPPPVFGGPFGSPPPMPPVAFNPKVLSPPAAQFPPVDFSSPPPFLPPPPPPQSQHANSYNQFSSPPGNGNEAFPSRYPPPLASSNGSGNIPTIGGLQSKTVPSHTHQPRPSGLTSQIAHQNNHHNNHSGNGNTGRRKRSFDQDESQSNYHHHHQQQQQHHSPRHNGGSRFNQRSNDQHLVPAQPVMSIPQYGNGFQPSTRPISTIVGVRRTNSGGSANGSADPRTSNGTRGSRGSRGHY